MAHGPIEPTLERGGGVPRDPSGTFPIGRSRAKRQPWRMSTPPAPPPAADTPPDPVPRRLTRSSSDRVLGGVAGGLGRYFDIDPIIFRLGFVVLTLAGGAGVLGYAAAWLLVPADPADGETGRGGPPPPPPPTARRGATAAAPSPTSARGCSRWPRLPPSATASSSRGRLSPP